MHAPVHEGYREGPSFSYSDVLIPPLCINRMQQDGNELPWSPAAKGCSG